MPHEAAEMEAAEEAGRERAQETAGKKKLRGGPDALRRVGNAVAWCE
jgi:hypothetical protein